MVDLTFVVAGEAGQGVRSTGEILAWAMVRGGYYVFAYPDVMSRIRGGHNFTRVRVSDRPVNCISPEFNLLLALDARSVTEHRHDLSGNALVVSEGSGQAVSAGRTRQVAIPMRELAKKQGGAAMAGVVGLGAAFLLAGARFELLEAALKERFGSKGRSVVTANLNSARAGFRVAEAGTAKSSPGIVPPVENPVRRLLLTGSQATGLGALAAGVRFYAGYPMSPATGIMEYLASKQKRFGLVVEQVEDEAGAVNAAIGASYAGVRAMTATSGGGFSLMTEGLGFAAMSENPVVIVVAQRPGPATGFPTRTEQAELLMAINAAADEFPRFVFAPGDAAQAFHATRRAFELAGKFQVPAIVLTDQQIADSHWTLEPETLTGDADPAVDFDDAEWDGRPAFTYRRYAVTDSGVSPRLRPGFPEQFVCCTGSEHDETGLPTEDAENRVRMHGKRMRKHGPMQDCFGEMTEYPGQDEDCIVLCFGSTLGAVREAVDILWSERKKVGLLHLGEVWPFPREKVIARIGRARQVITVENNSTGQLARLLTQETRRRPDEEILKSNGRPFAGAELANELRGLYRGRLG